jgi:hypothetical protein
MIHHYSQWLTFSLAKIMQYAMPQETDHCIIPRLILDLLPRLLLLEGYYD